MNSKANRHSLFRCRTVENFSALSQRFLQNQKKFQKLSYNQDCSYKSQEETKTCPINSGIGLPKIKRCIIFQWSSGFLHNSQLYVQNIRFIFNCAKPVLARKYGERRQKRKQKKNSTFALVPRSISRARLSRADFEVASYLWLDVLEVDINVGYCKHLTVRISIRRQPDAQPLERVKRVTLRRTSSRRILRGVHHRRRGVAATRSMHSTERYVSARNADENAHKRQRYLPDDIYLLIYFSVNWPSRDKVHTIRIIYAFL